MGPLQDKDGVSRYLLTFTVNGDEHALVVKANATLANVLRNELDLTGTKQGCELGDCGSCTVLLDGQPVNSCLVLALEADGREVTTIEGVAVQGKLDALQESMLNHGAVQCGYCTPGMILSAKALLTANPGPSELEVREAIGGNLCRCTGYVHIVEAVMAVAEGRTSSPEQGKGHGEEHATTSADEVAQ